MIFATGSGGMGEKANAVALALAGKGVAATAEPEPRAQDVIRVVVHGGHHHVTKEVIQGLVIKHHPSRIRIVTADEIAREIEREELRKRLLAPRRAA